jgi:fibronectin-binding autotransporter adhesin
MVISSRFSLRLHGVALLLVGVHATGSSLRADSLVQFNIETTATATGATTMPGSVTATPGLTATLMTSTGGSTTTGNSTSPAGTWNRTYAVTETTAAGSLTAGNWITWTTTAAPGYEYSFNGLEGLKLSRTSVGPTKAGLFYSTDGGTTFQQTGGDFTTSTTLTSAAPTFSTTMATTPIKLVNNADGIIWRLVGFGSGVNRMGVGFADAIDFTMLGTIDLTPSLNLTWAAAGGTGTWDTSSSNLTWTNDSGGAATAFTDGDNVSFPGTGGVVTVSGSVTAGSLTVSNPSGTYQLTGGTLATLGVAAKSGAGTLVLSTPGSFAQGWQISGGTLVADAANAVGSAVLSIDGATFSVANPAVANLSNPIVVGAGNATLDVGADVVITGAVTGATGSRFLRTGTNALTLSGQIGVQTSAPLELDLTAGTTTLSGGQKNLVGTNDWDAPVILDGATVHLHGGTITGSGTITSANPASRFISRLNAGPSFVTNSIVTNDTLIVDSPNGNNRLTISGAISGSGGLSVVGNGQKSLEGVNTYAGPTSVTAGGLRVNGSISNASTVTVTSATLSGNGLIDSAAEVGSGATLSLVDGVGASAMTFNQGLLMNASSTTQWFLLSNTDLGTAAGTPTGFSQTRVTGGNLTIPAGASVGLNFSYVVGGSETSTVSWSDTFWDAGHSWSITDFTGGGSATINNFTITNTSFLDSTGTPLDAATRGSFSITNDGQNMFLSFTAVPEPALPAAMALMAGALGLMSLRRRN